MSVVRFSPAMIAVPVDCMPEVMSTSIAKPEVVIVSEDTRESVVIVSATRPEAVIPSPTDRSAVIVTSGVSKLIVPSEAIVNGFNIPPSL